MNTLRDKAMTVCLKMSQFRPLRTDKAKTNALQAREGTSKYRVVKKVLGDCRELEEAQIAYRNLARYVRDNTLPWCDDGKRLLPNTSYIDFARRVGELRREADAKVAELAKNWKNIVAEDMKSFGVNANPDDYPDVWDMRSKWGINVRFEPIPDSSDFRVDMDENDKAMMEAEYSKAVADSSEYLLGELLTPIKKMVETLSMPEDKRGKRWFESSLVGNVKDICERARRLNFNNDPRVTEVCDAAEGILYGVDARMIKDNAEMAEDVASKMSDVEAKLSQWF